MPELLTAQLINSLAPKHSRYIVSDIKVPGLAIVVYPSGSKSFVYRYRAPKSRSVKSIPLGKSSKLAIKAARAAAKTVAADISRDIDPQQRRKERVK